MTLAPARTNLWEVLAGRVPGRPVAPDDPDMWQVVVDRLNPARARPVRRAGVEEAELVSARGQAYVMLRSPDREASYVRLAPEEAELTRHMDGSRTVAALVGDFARLTGRLAPDQVRQVVADLAANRMLEELPVDALRPLERVRRRSPMARLGQGALAAAKGQRMVLGDVDRLAGALYRGGGRFLFTRAAAIVMAAMATGGLALFVRAWVGGAQQAFLSGDSYAAGGILLLVLNALCLGAHELGHALAAKHAGRRVPAAGFLFYYGIPSAFVDTTDVWMAGRRARLLTTAAGPAAALTLAGACQLVGFLQPDLAPLAFKLSFCWYLNSLFNLNPMLALDGYYLLMDWLEIANLRLRGMAFAISKLRGRAPKWRTLDREGRIVAFYGIAGVVWLVVSLNLTLRTYRDRVSGLVAGLWHHGLLARAGLILFVAALASPALQPLVRLVARRLRARIEDRRRRDRLADRPARLDALRGTALAALPAGALDQLAEGATWRTAGPGDVLVNAGAAPPGVLVVVDGAVEARAPDDPAGSVRDRATAGSLVGVAAVASGGVSPWMWTSTGALLLVLEREAFLAAVPAATSGMAESGEREAVLSLPPFAGLADDDRLTLSRAIRPVDLAPGESLDASAGDAALVVATGVLAGPAGAELRRGDVLVPAEEARAVSRARLWAVPAALGHPPTPVPPSGAGVGVHGEGPHAPLAAPPGPPAGDDDGKVDGAFLRRFRRLLEVAAAAALLLLLIQCGRSTPWSEIPTDTALLVVREGTVDARVDGRSRTFEAGTRVVIGGRDTLHTRDESTGAVVFRGGGEVVLCPQTDVVLAQVGSGGQDPVVPRARVDVRAGVVRAQTAPVTGAFAPLALDVRLAATGAMVTSRDPARFSVSSQALTVDRGVVRQGEAVVAPTQQQLGCGAAPAVATVGEPAPPAPSPTAEDGGATPAPSNPPTTALPAGPAGPAGPVAPGPTPTPQPTPQVPPTTDPVDSTTPDSSTSTSSTSTSSTSTTSTTLPGTGMPGLGPGGTGGVAGPGPGGGAVPGDGTAISVPGATATPGGP